MAYSKPDNNSGSNTKSDAGLDSYLNISEHNPSHLQKKFDWNCEADEFAPNMAARGGSSAKANGVLPVAASQLATGSSRSLAMKSPSQKLKAVIRRLPPGLTEDEFTAILGESWRLGQGKVDWFKYEPGKDSKDPAKPSKPSRAYVHMTTEENLISLAEVISQTPFEDAENTFTNPCLVGPPVVEISLYSKIPGGRHRIDQRAGTIDQDPDYQSFLEDMTNPTIAKESAGETAFGSGLAKPEKVTSTPLIDFLRDKKTAKAAAAKAAKKQDSLLTKGKLLKELTGIEEGRKKGRDPRPDKSVERATKQTIKILNREASSRAGSSSSSSSKSSNEKVIEKPSDGATTKSTKGPAAQRGAATPGQVRMLQRDLGITPRLSRRELANAQKEERAAAASEPRAGTSPSSLDTSAIPTAPRAAGTSRNLGRPSRRTKGPALETNKSSTVGTSSSSPQTPVVLLKKPATPQTGLSTPSTPTTTTPATPTTIPVQPAPVLARISQLKAAPSDGATQAFVKHANPSQGVTEELLKQVLETFGAVSLVEIDKRKGFAYVNFVDTEGLKKAMAANPITVARGTVQVMQRKVGHAEKKPQHQAPRTADRGGRGGRGGTSGRRGGRGGMRGAASSSSDVPASTPAGPVVK